MILDNGPWAAALSPAQYMLVSFFLTAATLAFFAGFIRTWMTQGEVGARYRTAWSRVPCSSAPVRSCSPGGRSTR